MLQRRTFVKFQQVSQKDILQEFQRFCHKLSRDQVDAAFAKFDTSGGNNNNNNNNDIDTNTHIKIIIPDGKLNYREFCKNEGEYD